MSKESLGFDLGAVFCKLVVLSGDGAVLFNRAERHHGTPLKHLRRLLEEYLAASGDDREFSVGMAGRYADLLAGCAGPVLYDTIRADIACVKAHFPDVRNILNIGGGSVTLIRLNENGEFVDYSTNSMCAAGTGAFLDQQAKRLGLGYDDLERFHFDGDPPSIATRCSVFAKTDLIHRQQEGYSKPSLWAGLCKSLSRTCLNSVLRGRTLEGLTVLTGGVALNGEVLRWLQQQYGEAIQTFPQASFSSAIGAAMLAADEARPVDVNDILTSIEAAGTRDAAQPRRKPLALERSQYPDFSVLRSYVDDLGNEVRVSKWAEPGESVDGYLGIDIGSTSTKLVVMDRDENVLVDIYRATAGDPIDAVKKLFRALTALDKETGVTLNVAGVGTTGSGRKLVGHILSADMIVNEITAHLQGALHVDPEVETIFEIGGQDSKYIRAHEGRIRDSNMNYVCAAGTGSFVEEQAKKLGLKLEEVGDMVMGVSPPVTSDRCTVFMEQDVDYLIRLGFSREECMAAVMYSVVRNYLNKVVGRRTVSRKKVFFQGATARNKGLVAAFENIVDREIVVSPYCHVLGAFGAALIAKRHVQERGGDSRFPGLSFAEREVHMRTETCKLCENHCKITFARLDGCDKEQSWGYLCGREPGETRVRRRMEYEPMRDRRKIYNQFSVRNVETCRGTIAVPRALTAYSHMPFWAAFFERLGYKLKQTPMTDRETIALSGNFVAADFCLPAKIAHGQTVKAIQSDAEFVLLPYMICPYWNRQTTNSYFCPYVQSIPSVIKSTLQVHHLPLEKLLSPIMDFRKSRKESVRSLLESLGGPLGVDRAQVNEAWEAGVTNQREFEDETLRAGRAILDEVDADGKPAIVIFGRPYNIHDTGSNIGLPQKIAELGIKVIPLDMLPVTVDQLDPAYQNMYWAYGQRILACGDFVRAHPRLFGLYFTNFSCGPDSFLLTHIEQIMGEKPMLQIELDEHGGDAGYLTRIEAFLDVVKAWGDRELPPRPPLPTVETPDLTRGTIYVPPMHATGSRIFAAAFRRAGYQSVAMPLENEECCEVGRSLTRGSECLPMACTAGSIVSALASHDGKDGAVLFMPTASGPCRFGQYGLLHRSVLDRLGHDSVGILSPSGNNNYQGLGQSLRRKVFQALVVGDILEKCACKIRPYEKNPGETDRLHEEMTQQFEAVFEKGGNIPRALEEAVKAFAAIPRDDSQRKPLVGVVGEIYVRSNAFCNDNVVKSVEALGGEVWTSPVTEWVAYTSLLNRLRLARRPWAVVERFTAWLKDHVLHKLEDDYFDIAASLVGDRREPRIDEVVEIGSRYMPVEFQGEGILTVGRSVLYARRDKALLVINAAPFTCMPGTVSYAILHQVQAETGIPMVSIFYDGKPGQNERLAIYMKNLVPLLKESLSDELLYASEP